jgi:hypothetical protein
MRFSPLPLLAILGLAGCVQSSPAAPLPTTTLVSPAPTTMYVQPAPVATFVQPSSTTTVIHTP